MIAGARRALLMAFLALTGSEDLRAAPSDSLVVATYAYPQRDRDAAIRPLANYLATRATRNVEVRVLASPSALVEALERGEVDVAVPNLYAYLQALAAPGGIVSLPVPAVPVEQADRYRTVLIGRKGSAVLADLPARARTQRLVLVGPDSASGGLIPLAHLQGMGLSDPDSQFASVRYAGSHAAALSALTEGQADLAALAADVYDAASPAGLVELWRSPPIPAGPLLCREQSRVSCAQIGQWLLEAHRLDSKVMAGLRAGWPEFGDAQHFVPTDASVFRELARLVAEPQLP